MENLSHSLPKKSYRSNGFAGKTVYDDVFGAPPKFGVPTLSPRVEDYSEIFEGFHASRGSSIPILDLPAVDDDDADLFFDVRSSEFDYSEVFGGFNGLDFAVSYEELFKQSTRGDDSSDEAWYATAPLQLALIFLLLVNFTYCLFVAHLLFIASNFFWFGEYGGQMCL